MLMLNRIVLVGRLTKDPELKYTPNGIAVCSLTLAVNRPFSNQQGEREADFINCVIWRKPAENAAKFLKKGSLAGVDGRLQTRSYENSQGQRVYVTEVMAESIQFLEPKSKNHTQENQHQHNNSYNGTYNYGAEEPNNYSADPFANDSQGAIDDDGLPF